MAEVEQEVKTYTVGYLCDECGKGWMEPIGTMLTSNPPQWPHKCSECGEQQTFWEKYPTTIYRTIPNESLSELKARVRKDWSNGFAKWEIENAKGT